jgi:hypothetical protein
MSGADYKNRTFPIGFHETTEMSTSLKRTVGIESGLLILTTVPNLGK